MGFQKGGEEGNVQSRQQDGEEGEDGDGKAAPAPDVSSEAGADTPPQACKKFHTTLK
jgi:hypothetical protein